MLIRQGNFARSLYNFVRILSCQLSAIISRNNNHHQHHGSKILVVALYCIYHAQLRTTASGFDEVKIFAQFNPTSLAFIQFFHENCNLYRRIICMLKPSRITPLLRISCHNNIWLEWLLCCKPCPRPSKFIIMSETDKETQLEIFLVFEPLVSLPAFLEPTARIHTYT